MENEKLIYADQETASKTNVPMFALKCMISDSTLQAISLPKISDLVNEEAEETKEPLYYALGSQF
jgi:hypothetical protein